MKEIIENFGRLIPPTYKGYQFVKRIPVYIPFADTGLEILEKKEVALPFTYETILKLLSCEINNLVDMATLLGLELDILKEIIAQMAFEDLLTISEETLVITCKGKDALRELKKISVTKKQINQIYVNLISNEIILDDDLILYERTVPNCVCLDGHLVTDVQFFRDHFQKVKERYLIDKINEGVITDLSDSFDNLYRILGIAYQEMKFAIVYCFIYIDDENSLLFSFDNDKNLYASTLNQQINTNITGVAPIFERPYAKVVPPTENDEAKTDALKKLLQVFAKRTTTTVSVEEIEENYYSDRYLLDGELEDILLDCHSYDPFKITILSSNLKSFLQNTSLIEQLLSTNPKTVFSFIYNCDEYNIEKSILWIQKNLQKNSTNIKFHKLPVDKKVDFTRVICNPGFVIFSTYSQVTDNLQRHLLKNCMDISFDQISINQALAQADDMISQCN